MRDINLEEMTILAGEYLVNSMSEDRQALERNRTIEKNFEWLKSHRYETALILGHDHPLVSLADQLDPDRKYIQQNVSAQSLEFLNQNGCTESDLIARALESEPLETGRLLLGLDQIHQYANLPLLFMLIVNHLRATHTRAGQEISSAKKELELLCREMTPNTHSAKDTLGRLRQAVEHNPQWRRDYTAAALRSEFELEDEEWSDWWLACAAMAPDVTAQLKKQGDNSHQQAVAWPTPPATRPRQEAALWFSEVARALASGLHLHDYSQPEQLRAWAVHCPNSVKGLIGSALEQRGGEDPFERLLEISEDPEFLQRIGQEGRIELCRGVNGLQSHAAYELMTEIHDWKPLWDNLIHASRRFSLTGWGVSRPNIGAVARHLQHKESLSQLRYGLCRKAISEWRHRQSGVNLSSCVAGAPELMEWIDSRLILAIQDLPARTQQEFEERIELQAVRLMQRAEQILDDRLSRESRLLCVMWADAHTSIYRLLERSYDNVEYGWALNHTLRKDWLHLTQQGKLDEVIEQWKAVPQERLISEERARKKLEDARKKA